jgi:hypothetical protein
MRPASQQSWWVGNVSGGRGGGVGDASGGRGGGVGDVSGVAVGGRHIWHCAEVVGGRCVWHCAEVVGWAMCLVLQWVGNASSVVLGRQHVRPCGRGGGVDTLDYLQESSSYRIKIRVR